MNRLDDIVVFDILSQEAIRNIVAIQVEIVVKRLAEKEITLAVNEAALDYLSKEGYNPQYGARPLKRLIMNKILTPIADLIISGQLHAGSVVNVGIKNNEFVFDTKKHRKAAVKQKAGVK